MSRGGIRLPTVRAKLCHFLHVDFRQVISPCFWKKELILQVSEEYWLFSNIRNSSIMQPRVGLDSILDQASGPALLGGNWVPFGPDGGSRW